MLKEEEVISNLRSEKLQVRLVELEALLLIPDHTRVLRLTVMLDLVFVVLNAHMHLHGAKDFLVDTHRVAHARLRTIVRHAVADVDAL